MLNHPCLMSSRCQGRDRKLFLVMTKQVQEDSRYTCFPNFEVNVLKLFKYSLTGRRVTRNVEVSGKN